VISFLFNKICPRKNFGIISLHSIDLLPQSTTNFTPTKKPPAWGGSLLSAYCFSCSSRLGQCPPKLANGRAKEKEEVKTASLSMHF
jgi:hypothetical protein